MLIRIGTGPLPRPATYSAQWRSGLVLTNLEMLSHVRFQGTGQSFPSTGLAGVDVSV
jgi:hypothetical protein